MSETYFQTYLNAVEECENRRDILGAEIVIFPPNPAYPYDPTPRNALTFAAMGVDGVHYAVLTRKGKVEDDSPVIQISPMDGEPYSVLAENFLSYLAMACDQSVEAMKAVFARERAGEHVLIPVLMKQFSMSNIWKGEKPKNLSWCLGLIEQKP